MPTTGSKRKATTAAVKAQAKPNTAAATRKRGRVQRAALSNVANSNDTEASDAPKDKAPTARVTRNRSKKATTGAAAGSNAAAAPFVAYVDPEFAPGDATAVALNKQESNASLESLSNDPHQASAAVADAASAAAGASASATALSDDTTPYADVLKALPPMAGDPLLASWYKDDIFRLFRKHEGDFRAPSDYMEQLDRDINAQMRGILIDWIVEVGEMYGLKDQTIFLTTNYIDRYVATHIVPRSCLQLVGVTCLQIASKYSESACPTGDQFAYISVTPIEEIVRMERKIIHSLSYRLCVVTALDFVAHYSRCCHASETATMLARYFLELTLQEYSFLNYSASVTAASALKMALYFNDDVPWGTVSHAFDHGASELAACCQALYTMLKAVGESTLPAVKEKYSHSKCLRVSDCSFNLLELEQNVEGSLYEMEVDV